MSHRTQDDRHQKRCGPTERRFLGQAGLVAVLVVADRWHPSSKTCSGCGHVKAELDLGERSYRCETCGLVLDRDVNAAINLARWPDTQRAPPQPAAA